MGKAMAEAFLPGVETGMTVKLDHSTGLLPDVAIREAIAGHEIQAAKDIETAQIQPASLDLRFGPIAYRVRASFLPGRDASVAEKLPSFAMHEIDLSHGAVLEKGCCYIVPLVEHLALKKRTMALANPKSSTGRLDIFARLITDYGEEFDRVRERYRGPLFAEVSPRTFSVLAREGSCLLQLRIRRGSPPASDTAMRRLHEEQSLVDAKTDPAEIRGGLPIRVDLSGEAGGGMVGYRAKKHAGLIDLDKINHYPALDYWDPIAANPDRRLILDPDEFYILTSREAVSIPPTHAAEMTAYDPLVGEFRVHYAGFFDPGFGSATVGAGGTRAVLEVRSHEVPFVLEDGQIVGRLTYERLIGRPSRLYGRGIGSSYQSQGLALAKQFRR